MDVTPEQKKVILQNLLNIAKHHKAHCDKEDCGCSTYMLGEAYSLIAGRTLTHEETMVFL